MAREIEGAMRLFVYRVTEENISAIKKEYRVNEFAKGKPQLRYYPNKMKGDVKAAASFVIYFDIEEKNL